MVDTVLDSQHDDAASEIASNPGASRGQLEARKGLLCASTPLEGIGSQLDPATGGADAFDETLLGLA